MKTNWRRLRRKVTRLLSIWLYTTIRATPFATKLQRSKHWDSIMFTSRSDSPTVQDLQAFFEAMERHAQRRVWVHCAANMRVTAFLGLFRALRQGYSEERAFEPMHSVWKPNAVWSTFIAAQLARAQGG